MRETSKTILSYFGGPKDIIEYNRNVAMIMVNLLMPKMKIMNMNFDELREYREDMYPTIHCLATLKSNNNITHKHLKEVFEYIWERPFVCVFDYLISSKILEETSGDELISIVKEVIQENADIVNQIKNGKVKAIGSLVGKVLSKNKKCNPSEIKEIIENILQI